MLVVIGLVIPAIIVFIVCLFIGLGPPSEKTSSRSKVFKRKLWEWNASWLGLGLSLAIAFFITDGTKNLVGKPRPDLLARCNPDLSRLLSSAVGGVGEQVDEGINLVSWTICRNPGSTLDEGFRSFPSGHSSCKPFPLRPILEFRVDRHHSFLRGPDLSCLIPQCQISYYYTFPQLPQPWPESPALHASPQAGSGAAHVPDCFASHPNLPCNIRLLDQVFRLHAPRL